MKKITDFIDKWGKYILFTFIFFIFIQTCSVRKNSLSKDEVRTIISDELKKQDIKPQIKEVINMQKVEEVIDRKNLEYLMVEQELDKGKITLTEIQLRINNKYQKKDE